MNDLIESRPTPTCYFQLILRRFGQDQATRNAIMEGVGLTEAELDDPGAQLTVRQQARQFDNMNRLFGEGWTLDAPELWRPASHGALGVAVTSSANVRSAMETLCSYASSWTPNMRLKLLRRPDGYLIRQRVVTPLSESQNRVIAEAVALSIAALLQTMLGGRPDRIAFQFQSRRPHYGERLDAMLGGQVVWQAETDSIFAPRDILDVTSPMADFALHEAALSRLEQSVRSASAPDGVRTRVERLLAQSENGRMSSASAARRMGLSQRTLVRRLAGSGVSFRGLVDAELKDRARRLLGGGALSRIEIADRLGFADGTGFSRACRRWFRDENLEVAATSETSLTAA